MKKAMAAVVNVGKAFGFDGTLLGAVPGVLSKAPSDRVQFDEMTLQKLEESIAKSISDLSTTIANWPTQAERAAAVESITKVRDLVQDQFNNCVAVHTQSQNEQRVAQAALEEAKKAAKVSEPALEKKVKDCNAKKAKLETFVNGPLAVFKELEALAPPPPPVEEVAMPEQGSAEAAA